ncbi:tRNA pseudouridine(38-40) synthase TruA [Natronosalvus vescus]|uniref:tRNA pseudouridine(38-40) synthase TruA n=1 Tax=Natronosalvus vescus TaxID=2953881 RepID=UPI0020901092|nr:tRNA pseudouridine(38-40) synthase TruA [Natronosalvus vescus]
MRAYRLAYDGTDYFGFQRQPNVPTVEDKVFDALRNLDVLATDARKPAGYAAAGRTDAGVSALAQTIAFEAPDWLSPRAFNSALSADIRAWASAEAPADFHATHHATRRTYSYHLYAPRDRDSPPSAVAGARPVDDDRVHAALEALSGTHDVANLTPDDEGTRRTLTLEAERDGSFLEITVSAPGFARELVRRLVALVHAVATGAEPLAKIDRVLDPEPLPGHEGIAPAPPEPLVLTDVTYPVLTFERDTEAARRTHEIFERLRLERTTGARVAKQLCQGLE